MFKSLRHSFLPVAALGLGMLVSGCFDNNDSENNNPVIGDTYKLNDLFPATNDSMFLPGERPYLFDYTSQTFKFDNSGSSQYIGVQTETAYLALPSLTLEGPGEFPLQNHGKAAAHAMNNRADRLSGGNADVRYVEPVDYDYIYRANDRVLKNIFNEASVISHSVKTLQTVNDDSYIDTLPEISRTDSLWRKNVFWIQAAGNEGEKSVETERQIPDITSRGNHVIIVGEAGQDEQGSFITSTSSRYGTSIVVENPYMQDLSYPYFTPAGAAEYLDDLYNSTHPDTALTIAQYFSHNLRAKNNNIGQSARPVFEQFLQDWICDSDPQRSPFTNRDALARGTAWQNNNPEKVRQAYIEYLVRTAECLQNANQKNFMGDVADLKGSSFSAPDAAGMILAGLIRYQDLAFEDIHGAVLTAAKPLTRLGYQSGEKNAPHHNHYIDPASRSIDYRENGRGISYNNGEAGFGLLTADRFFSLLDSLSSLKQKHGLYTESRQVQSGLHKPELAKQDSLYNYYAVDIDEDIFTLNIKIALKFARQRPPETIKLLAPNGSGILLAPSYIPGGMDFSLARTDGHFGTMSAGQWVIAVPANAEVEQMMLDIDGMNPGNPVDFYLEKTGYNRHDRNGSRVPNDSIRKITPLPPVRIPTQ